MRLVAADLASRLFMLDDRMSKAGSWSRRGLLSARGLGVSAGGLLGAVMSEQETPTSDPRRRIAHWCFARRAMGCEFSVFLPPTAANPMAAAEAGLDEIERMEALLSVYRRDSAISYLNQHAADAPVRVDDCLFQLLKGSAKLTEQTSGAFDVSAGALVRAWGFLGGPRQVPDEPKRRAALAADPDRVWDILSDGARRASAIAAETIAEAKASVGLP